MIFLHFFPLMMRLKFFSVYLTFSYPAVAFLALAVICDRKGAVVLCLMSSIMHESGHLLAMKLTGARLKSINFNLGEVAINADSVRLSYGAEIFVTISGVLVNFIISFISFVVWLIFNQGFLFKLCISNLLIGVFNLLPVRFLDGGQLLSFILKRRLTPEFTDKLLNIVTVIFLVPIGVVAFIFIFNSSFNYSLLFAAVYLIYTLVSKEFKYVS